MNDEREIEVRLAELGRRTDAIRPSVGFSERVLSALAAEREPGWLDIVSFSSKRFLSVAALAAVVAVVWAVKSQSTVDDALASSYGAMDPEW